MTKHYLINSSERLKQKESFFFDSLNKNKYNILYQKLKFLPIVLDIEVKETIDSTLYLFGFLFPQSPMSFYFCTRIHL